MKMNCPHCGKEIDERTLDRALDIDNLKKTQKIEDNKNEKEN